MTVPRLLRLALLLVVVVSLALASLAIATSTNSTTVPPDPSAKPPASGPSTPRQSTPGQSTQTPLTIGGTRGVGDPYFPDYGSGGYDAVKYAVDVDFDPNDGTLTGRTVITARATARLNSFYLDLALPASKVLVNDVEATFALEGFQDLRITPSAPVKAGREFSVTVEYAGTPGSLPQPGFDESPWRTGKDEWLVAGEPEASAWWYPANDHPSDPALLDVSIRVPRTYQAISVGRLVSRDTGDEAEFDTWRWQTSQPAPTYATFLAIGRYSIREGEADGRPSFYAVSEQIAQQDRERIFVALERTPTAIRELEAFAGPYPYTEIGGIVPAIDLWFAGLETATRPVYHRGALLDEEYSDELLVHELAHMWFGDHVTLLQWNDIFTNEAFASWAHWEVVARRGDRSTDAQLARTYGMTRRSKDFWRVTMIDPGKEELFNTVYVRGPMTLAALDNVMGDVAFDALIRSWAQQPSGPRSLEDFMAAAQSHTAVDLGPFFQDWVYDTDAPARTKANGLR